METGANTTDIWYNQTPIFASEATMDGRAFQIWLYENRRAPCVISAVYVSLVFAGRRYMQTKAAFQLRPALIVWSSILAVFSILGTLRSFPELIFVAKNYGWETTVCDSSVYFNSSKLWAALFTLSKVYELGDTIFIILRKQNLILLHWYHHATVLMYTWYCTSNADSIGRIFANVNYFVHSMMYSYYALRAMRIKVPKWIPVSITIIQTLQMVVGLVVNYTAYRVLNRGETCGSTYSSILLGVIIYASYFVLFAHFFWTSYLAGALKSKLNKQKSL